MIADAIRTLRTRAGESLRVFGARLKLSTYTVHLHEHGRYPELRALFAYWVEADRQNDNETLAVITRAINRIVTAPRGWTVEWRIKRTIKKASD